METFMIKSPRGRECRIGIRKQYDFDELWMNHLKPLGKKWTICWESYGGFWFHVDKWMDFLDDRKPEDVVDQMFEKYGHGKVWGFVEEVAVRA